MKFGLVNDILMAYIFYSLSMEAEFVEEKKILAIQLLHLRLIVPINFGNGSIRLV